MSDAFYSDMQQMADELLDEFRQGQVVLVRTTKGAVDPDEPWIPTVDTTARTTLKATVKRKNQRYENGILIIATGDEVTFSHPGFEVQMTDKIEIDGSERAIESLRRVPAAGTVVVWKAFCSL